MENTPDLAALTAKFQAERGSKEEAARHDMIQVGIKGALTIGISGPTVGLEAIAQGFALVIDRPVSACRPAALELIQALVAKFALYQQQPEGEA